MIKETVVLGLTGGIACGKSTVAERFRQAGAVVIDADLVAREVVAPSSPGLEAIVADFGAEMLTAEGELDRTKLGARVFDDPDARNRLNRITHPRIAVVTQQRVMAAADAGAQVVLYDAALLLESGGSTAWLDAVIVVAASESTQTARMARRDGFTEREARTRIAAQMPLAQKRLAADYVVENDGSYEDLQEAVSRLFRQLNARFSLALDPGDSTP